MLWVVSANDELKEHFLAKGISNEVKIEWVNKTEELFKYPAADAFFDLLFTNNKAGIDVLSRLLPKPVIINAVACEKLRYPFVRINGWNTFLEREIMEAACPDEGKRLTAENFFHLLNRKTEWTPDIAGFISARVVSMIINEAYFALEEGVSSKNEIDIAMKLGTNYPYGPFEWAEKIGLKNIYQLLQALSKTEKRYLPAQLLQQEAEND